MPIQVLIVDDSALMRQVMSEILVQTTDIQVIGTAPDPLFALERMKVQWPDVVVLDVEMPRMDGVSFLQKIMSTRPVPVIICSTLVGRGTEVSLNALSAGAFAVVEKPKLGLKDFLHGSAAQLVAMIRAASVARIDRLVPSPTTSSAIPGKVPMDPLVARSGTRTGLLTESFVAIGCSTGGTQALEFVLSSLSRTSPGIVIVQHMPEQFTRGFAQRLDKLCQIEVKEAETGDRVLPGRAIIAQGGKHLLVERSGAQFRVEVKDGPPVSRHKPSVDVLFRSVAKSAGPNATGFIMTGMGDDGARGMREMHDAGASTYAQDEASCVVFGMPKEAIKLGGVDHVVGLDRIPRLIEAIHARSLVREHPPLRDSPST